MNEIAAAAMRGRRCAPGASALPLEQVRTLLEALPGWEMEGGCIARTFRFGSYLETMAFVNAAAWISHRQEHHPELLIGYDSCKVTYTTHSIGGLSENDFICAAKVDALFQD